MKIIRQKLFGDLAEFKKTLVKLPVKDEESIKKAYDEYKDSKQIDLDNFIKEKSNNKFKDYNEFENTLNIDRDYIVDDSKYYKTRDNLVKLRSKGKLKSFDELRKFDGKVYRDYGDLKDYLRNKIYNGNLTNDQRDNYRKLYNKLDGKENVADYFSKKYKRQLQVDLMDPYEINDRVGRMLHNIKDNNLRKKYPEIAEKVDNFETDRDKAKYIARSYHDYNKLKNWKIADQEGVRQNKKYWNELVKEEMSGVPKYRKTGKDSYDKYNPNTKQWEKYEDYDKKDGIVKGIVIDPKYGNAGTNGKRLTFGEGYEHSPFTVLHEGIKNSGHTYKYDEFQNHLKENHDGVDYDVYRRRYHGVPIEELRADNNIIRFIKSHPGIPKNAKKQMIKQAKNFRDRQLKYGYGFDREKGKK